MTVLISSPRGEQPASGFQQRPRHAVAPRPSRDCSCPRRPWGSPLCRGASLLLAHCSPSPWDWAATRGSHRWPESAWRDGAPQEDRGGSHLTDSPTLDGCAGCFVLLINATHQQRRRCSGCRRGRQVAPVAEPVPVARGHHGQAPDIAARLTFAAGGAGAVALGRALAV